MAIAMTDHLREAALDLLPRRESKTRSEATLSVDMFDVPPQIALVIE